MIDLRVEAVPLRVLEICRIIDSGITNKDNVKNVFLPDELNSTDSTHSDYFNNVLSAAKKMELVSEIGNTLKYRGDKNVIKSIDNFRFYCNTHFWFDDSSEIYEATKLFVKNGLEWAKQLTNLTEGSTIAKEIEKCISTSNSQKIILAERFWLSFLGFGYIYEKGTCRMFLPNMCVALKDFIRACNFQKNTEIKIKDFMQSILNICPLIGDEVEINYTLSSALRCLHDNKEIELKNNSDSEFKIQLYKSKAHDIPSSVTHIVIFEE